MLVGHMVLDHLNFQHTNFHIYLRPDPMYINLLASDTSMWCSVKEVSNSGSLLQDSAVWFPKTRVTSFHVLSQD